MRKILLAGLSILAFNSAAFAVEPIKWQGWTPDLFQKSSAEKRLVILDMKAVWCHWCHVMEETTYRDPEVVELINKHFVAVQVDQDGNPDLSNRYGEWGWPATILFAPDGTEIAKLRGYRNPDEFEAILKAFIADPTPGPSVDKRPDIAPAQSHSLTEVTRNKLKAKWIEAYDKLNGGWGGNQRFIPFGQMEYALALAETGDATAIQMARQTLDASLALIDPVWGGVYQYSDKPDWSSPHYEKIMSFQAQSLRSYAQAYRLFGEARYKSAADAVANYLMDRMRGTEGAFYATQDADLSSSMSGKQFYALDAVARDKLGTQPRIDTNLYARENGMAIEALAGYGLITSNASAVAAAEKAASWIVANRSIDGGGFSHGAKDRSGPYLGDSLYMSRAALALYATTGERQWLVIAGSSAAFIAATFKATAGFATTKSAESTAVAFSKPIVDPEENMELARHFNLLSRYAGLAAFREQAEHAMKALASPQITESRLFLGELLVADQELAIEPVHITIVGHKDDPAALRLLEAAHAFPAQYARIDWWDTREGPLVNPDVTYPDMGEAAAFACSNQICSQPAFQAAELTKVVQAMMKLRKVTME